MMGERYIHVVVLMLLAVFAACSSDECVLQSAQVIQEPLKINVDLNNASVTRSTISTGNEWTADNQVVLVVGNMVDGSDDPATTTLHSYKATAGEDAALSPVSVLETNYWTTTLEKKKIVKAWSYGNGNSPKDDLDENNNITDFSLASDQNSNVKELLYSPGANTIQYHTIQADRDFSIIFYHLLTKVYFTITSDINVNITAATMTVPGSGTLTSINNETYNAVWSSGDNATIYPHGAQSQNVGPSTSAIYSAVVIPGSYDEKTLLELKIGGDNNHTYKFVPATLSLASGKVYSYALKLENGIEYSSVNVTDWTVENVSTLYFK